MSRCLFASVFPGKLWHIARRRHKSFQFLLNSISDYGMMVVLGSDSFPILHADWINSKMFGPSPIQSVPQIRRSRCRGTCREVDVLVSFYVQSTRQSGILELQQQYWTAGCRYTQDNFIHRACCLVLKPLIKTTCLLRFYTTRFSRNST